MFSHVYQDLQYFRMLSVEENDTILFVDGYFISQIAVRALSDIRDSAIASCFISDKALLFVFQIVHNLLIDQCSWDPHQLNLTRYVLDQREFLY